MKLIELASFEVAHEHISWPWVAFDASGQRFAYCTSKSRIATRVVSEGTVAHGPTFALAADFAVHSFTLDAAGTLLAAVGNAGAAEGATGAALLVTLDVDGHELRRSSIETLIATGFMAQAVAFDRSGTRLWISAESPMETALAFVDARTHAPLGVVRSGPFPPPAMHELTLHPQEDAILALAACGEDGTFARVARWSNDRLEAVKTALDDGSIPAGLVGFSSDGARLHLAEADELRTHAWPGLQELSSVEFADDFVSSFAGAILSERILVDGEDSEAHEDAVMAFDTSALRGKLAFPPVPTGMWAGRLGDAMLVTVEAKGEPSRGRVLHIAD
jgi:hypothetical protein